MENPKPQDVKDVKKTDELSEKDLKTVNGGAVNQFLKIDGVDGENSDAKHTKEINVLA